MFTIFRYIDLMSKNAAFSREAIAAHIATRLAEERERLAADFMSPDRVPSACIDNVLPTEIVEAINAAFPKTDRMMLKRSIRENKHVAAQMDQYDPLLEEAVFAFQDRRVVEEIAHFSGLLGLEPDANLYAGGISAMSRGAYLRPHLDNSHDGARSRYRVLNLLFYVTPDWSEAEGGSLQLWDEGPGGPARTVASRFNRLVIMATNRSSWHSVNEVKSARTRHCVSNYYFSRISPEDQDYFHATSFRGEPHQRGADMVMRLDNAFRTTALKVAGRLYRNPHGYHRPEN